MGSMQDIDIDEAIAKTDEKLKQQGIDPNASAVEEEGQEEGFLKVNKADGSEEGAEGDDDKGGEGDDDKGGEGGEGEGDDDKGGEGDPDDKGAGATATNESGEEVTFKSAEALSKFVSEQVAILNKKGTSEEDAEAAKEALKSVKIFDEKWKPKDWNDALVQLVPHIRKMIKEEDAADTAKVEASREEFNKKLDSEYDGLVKDKKIPARGTEDGKRVNRELAAVGSAYGLGSYRTAYDIWSKMPKGTEITLPTGDKVKVGGLEGSTTTTTTTKKVNPSKAASRRIAGNSTPAATAGDKKKADYSKIHNRSMDNLLDEAIGE